MAGLLLDAEGRQTLDSLFDKWTLLVLDALCDKGLRFSELKRMMPAVTPKSLTETLRRLERNGIVQREVVAASPVRVVYHLTPMGKSLEAPLHEILGWVIRHGPEVKAAQDSYDLAVDHPVTSGIPGSVEVHRS